MLQPQQNQNSMRVLTPKKLQVIEQVLDTARKLEYAEVTLIVERGVLRKIQGPAPSIMLPK